MQIFQVFRWLISPRQELFAGRATLDYSNEKSIVNGDYFHTSTTDVPAASLENDRQAWMGKHCTGQCRICHRSEQQFACITCGKRFNLKGNESVTG